MAGSLALSAVLCLLAGCSGEGGLTLPVGAVTLADATTSPDEEVSSGDVTPTPEPDADVAETGDASTDGVTPEVTEPTDAPDTTDTDESDGIAPGDVGPDTTPDGPKPKTIKVDCEIDENCVIECG
ncbi:MAG: hypothetical protein VYE15_00380, partial [Myxococcota bacterium]|nr:hypothetical protein [Myxococcota bacterium]